MGNNCLILSVKLCRLTVGLEPLDPGLEAAGLVGRVAAALVRLAADDVLAHGEVGEGVGDAGPRQPHHLRHRVVQVQHVGPRALRHPLIQQSAVDSQCHKISNPFIK